MAPRGGTTRGNERDGSRAGWTASRGAWVAGLGLLLAGAAPAQAIDPLLAAMGKETYQRHCASCHGTGGRGGGPVAKTLRRQPTDLTRIAARRGGAFPAGEIARAIDGRFDVTAHGTRRMPVWGQRLAADVPDARLAEEISRGTIASLVEYLKTIQNEAPEEPVAADDAEGRQDP